MNSCCIWWVAVLTIHKCSMTIEFMQVAPTTLSTVVLTLVPHGTICQSFVLIEAIPSIVCPLLAFKSLDHNKELNIIY